MDANIQKQDCGADFVEVAVQVGQTIEGSEGRGEILILAADFYAEADQNELAASLAQTIDDSYQRELALSRIAVKLAGEGEEDQAESLLEMIDDDAAYGLAVEELAAAYARNGEIDKAIAIAERLSDSAAALCGIALACPSAVQVTDCIEVARSIEYPELKATTMVELAGKASTLDDQTDFTELLQEALAAAEAIDFPQQRIEARVAIAKWFREHQQTEQADEVLQKARADCEEVERLGRDTALAQIAQAYAELHEFDRANQLLEEIEDPFQFCHASRAVALEEYRSGDEAAALKLLADGLEVIKDEAVYSQEALNVRETVCGNLAWTYAEIGHLEDALRVTELLASPEQLNAVLTRMAVTLAKNDDLSVVFRALDRIRDNSARVLCEIELARGWTSRNQPALASHILGKASVEVAAVERRYLRAICLAELAQAYQLSEQTSRAAEVLLEALKTAATINGGYDQARALLSLAVKHRELSRPTDEPELRILDDITGHLD